MCPTGESEPVHLDHRLRTARTVRPRSPPHLPTGEPACAASGPTIGPFIPGRTRPGSPRTGPPPATEKEPETTHQRRHRNRDNVVATVVVPDWQRRLIRNVGSPGHWTGACDPPALSRVGPPEQALRSLRPSPHEERPRPTLRRCLIECGTRADRVSFTSTIPPNSVLLPTPVGSILLSRSGLSRVLPTLPTQVARISRTEPGCDPEHPRHPGSCIGWACRPFTVDG